MNGKLILSGGGDLQVSYDLDAKFFSLLRNNARILYIPIALKRDRIGFEACFDWFAGVVATHAKNKDIDFTMFLDNEPLPDLKKYDCVYIGGGNTFKLLDFFVKNDIDKKIFEYLNSGGIVYGGSAGAIIFGKDIRTVEEENDKNYSFNEGLNCLNNYSLICHYDESLDNKIVESSKKISGKILALYESSGIILSKNDFEIIGDVVKFNPSGIKTIHNNKNNSLKLLC